MTLSVKDAANATQTIKTNDDLVGVAGTPNANVLTFQGVSGGTAIAVSGTVAISNLAATQPISGTVTVANPTAVGITDTQLRASAVPVSLASTPGLTDTQLRAAGVPVLGPLTDTQIRLTALPVSGPLTDAQMRASLVAVSGVFFQATQPVSLATSPTLVAGSAIIGKIGIDQTTPGLTNGVQINAALPAGTNLIGGIVRVPSATQTMPSRARIASAVGTNATSVKATAGAVYHIVAANMATSARFLKLYDKASAPTVGTDTPIATIFLPANGGFAELFDIPIGFSTGIAYAITGLVADTDTTAIALNDIHGFILYA